MGGLRRWRRWLVAGAVVCVPGLLGFDPVLADPAEAAQEVEGAPPELSLPVVEPEIPTEIPEPTVVSAGDVATRSVEDLPEPGPELVDRRDAVTEVFANADGTETVMVHAEPVHYQPEGSPVWEEIDNSVVADEARPGWVRNAANDWTARFGPITAGGGGGVELSTDAGVVHLVPEIEAGSGPVVPLVGTGEEADTVTYEDVWPDVDVVYTVSGGRVKEDIVVHDGGTAAYPFVVEGLGLEEPTLGVAQRGRRCSGTSTWSRW